MQSGIFIRVVQTKTHSLSLSGINSAGCITHKHNEHTKSHKITAIIFAAELHV